MSCCGDDVLTASKGHKAVQRERGVHPSQRRWSWGRSTATRPRYQRYSWGTEGTVFATHVLCRAAASLLPSHLPLQDPTALGYVTWCEHGTRTSSY